MRILQCIIRHFNHFYYIYQNFYEYLYNFHEKFDTNFFFLLFQQIFIDFYENLRIFSEIFECFSWNFQQFQSHCLWFSLFFVSFHNFFIPTSTFGKILISKTFLTIIMMFCPSFDKFWHVFNDSCENFNIFYNCCPYIKISLPIFMTIWIIFSRFFCPFLQNFL